MRSAAHDATLWTPLGEQDKAKVREQMNRLLETSHFNNSRRYPALLRFIVEETLEGRGEYLKERLIGISVFNRPADYDTASDPIVRVTIAEIRKRIAQYYHDEAHDTEMRIELSPGHYAPEFRPSREVGPIAARSAETLQPATAFGVPEVIHTEPTPPVPVTEPAGHLRWGRLLTYAGLAVVLVALAGAGWRWSHPLAIDQLWQPVLAAHGPVMVCLPAGAGKDGGMTAVTQEDMSSNVLDRRSPSASTANPTFLDHESIGENVVFSDMLATLKMTDLLSTRGREYRVRLNIATALDDLRQGPVILIGGMDNQWTLRAIAPLRYSFLGNGNETYWISDKEHPEKKDWSLDLKSRYIAVNHDYALIARTHNEQTGQVEMIAAGIGMSGTAAAGEFLADPARVEELRHRVGRGFAGHDFEAVLRTDVINGIAGSPKILAVQVW